MSTAVAPELCTESRPSSPVWKWLSGPWPLVLFFFFATLIFNTRHNELPYYYEKDAPSKVRQVVTGDRNFFHPLLMLNTADVFLTLSGAERTHQNAVIAGRWAIALFTSLGIAAFTMLAWRMEGRAAALAVGTLLFTFPLLFELSHIFKEDPALVGGLGLAFLAMHIFWTKRGAYQAGWMGAACAIAISGKYVGIAAVIMSIALLIFVRKDRPKQNRGRWIAYIASLLVALSVVNYQLIANLPTFAFGFKTEIADLTRKDKRDDIPHIRQVQRTLKKETPNALAFIFAATLIYAAVRRRRDPLLWMLILYPVVFTVILAYSPRLFTRHFLPVLVIVNVAGGIGLVAILRELLSLSKLPQSVQRYGAYAILPISFGIVVSIYLHSRQKDLLNYYNAFAEPTRETFIREAIYKLPEDAVIASDFRVHLLNRNGKPREHLPVPQKVLVVSQLAQFGSLERLQELGVTHVAVHGLDSRYLFKKVEGKKRKKENKKKSKYDMKVYDEILDEGKLVYHIRGKGSNYNAPALRLYKLPKSVPSAP